MITITSSVSVLIPLNDILVLPPHLVAQAANGAVFPSRLQPQYSKRLWYDHTLLLVVWWWDTFEYL